MGIQKKQISNSGKPLNVELYYCPISYTPLQFASEALVNAFNSWIESGTIMNDNGDQITGSVPELLVNNTRSYAYQLKQGIPQLIPGLAVSLEGFKMVNYVD